MDIKSLNHHNVDIVLKTLLKYDNGDFIVKSKNNEYTVIKKILEKNSKQLNNLKGNILDLSSYTDEQVLLFLNYIYTGEIKNEIIKLQLDYINNSIEYSYLIKDFVKFANEFFDYFDLFEKYNVGKKDIIEIISQLNNSEQVELLFKFKNINSKFYNTIIKSIVENIFVLLLKSQYSMYKEMYKTDIITSIKTPFDSKEIKKLYSNIFNREIDEFVFDLLNMYIKNIVDQNNNINKKVSNYSSSDNNSNYDSNSDNENNYSISGKVYSNNEHKIDYNNENNDFFDEYLEIF